MDVLSVIKSHINVQGTSAALKISYRPQLLGKLWRFVYESEELCISLLLIMPSSGMLRRVARLRTSCEFVNKIHMA
jgi:hypothetical protein